MDPVEHLLAHARAKDQARLQLQQRLNMAMSQPDKLVQHRNTMVGIRDDDGTKVLMIATSDGTREDIQLSSEVVVVLKRALLGEVDG